MERKVEQLAQELGHDLALRICELAGELVSDGGPQLLRAREAAMILKVSERTCRRLAYEGEIPSVKVGSSLRFDPQALAEWWRSQSEGGT